MQRKWVASLAGTAAMTSTGQALARHPRRQYVRHPRQIYTALSISVACVPAGFRLIGGSALQADPKIQTVAKQRVIGRSATRVQAINPGPTSHAQGMLMAYLPAHKLLFQGDFLRINALGGPALGTEIVRELETAIRRLRLDVRHIAAVHGLNSTIDDLRTAAKARDTMP